MDTATAEQPATPTAENDGWEWCFLEIMGHRSHLGRSREEERFGAKMIRIDVPIDGDPASKGWLTHYYGGASIFSYSIADEATVLKRNKPYEPPSRFSVHAVTIDVCEHSMPTKLDGSHIGGGYLHEFARADGFAGAGDMLEFWKEEHGIGRFDGVLINWKPIS
jgi:hypothetical protein